MTRRGEILTVFYDEKKRDWDEQTERELRRRGLEYKDVRVIFCYPKNNQMELCNKYQS